MKIEEGKYYRTSDGHRVGPMKPGGYEGWPWIVEEGNGYFWADNGSSVGAIDSPDLIAEWTDEPRPWKDLTDEEKGALLLAEYEGPNFCVEYKPNGDDGWGQKHKAEAYVDDWTYRIKPEPTRETVALYGEESYSGFWGFDSGSEDPSEYRITFDLVDGVPDCASIKMEEV